MQPFDKLRANGWWLIALVLVLLAVPVSAQTFPPLTGRVVDQAKLLSPDQVQQLTQLSDQIEQASSRQFVVATVTDLQGYPIEDYGYRLGRAWKIGQGEANNGIILLVAPKERQVRIEVGYGLEPIMTDALSNQIIRDTIVPRFKAGDMAGGIMAGATAIGEQMKLPLEAAEARAKAQLDARPRRAGGNDAGGWIATFLFVGFILFFVVLPIVAGRGGRGRRYRSGLGEALLWGATIAANSRGSGGSSWGGGFGGGGDGGGGFSGGGGSFGGGGASGSW